jgi:hypothetical protein
MPVHNRVHDFNDICLYLALLIVADIFPIKLMADTAYFAYGCSWCVESDFEKLEEAHSNIISSMILVEGM